MSTPSKELLLEIKQMIMDTLGINDLAIEDIDDEKPLFGGDNALTLDSVDAIEIVMAIQRNYGVRITDQHIAREVVRSVNSIAQFITENRPG
ncbi:MAG: phosphopantetheine-binding protein [Bacteroidales bacterium]|jgi:acyl carrier protein|nr:phosphopantetheine-binding protein [Bacteroidales bacterium]